MQAISPSPPRSWNFFAKITLAWGIVVLLLSGIGIYSNFQHVGEWTLGAFTVWMPIEHRLMVNVLTPPGWPGLAEGIFQVDDYVLAVNGHKIENIDTAYALDDFLATQVDENGQPWLHVLVEHEGKVFETVAPAMQLSMRHLFEQLWVLLISGLSLWGLGLVVLLAQPNSAANRVLAVFLFMGELVLVGSLERIEDDFYRWIYDYVIIYGPRPFLGAFLIHLAMLYPEPVRNLFWRRLRFVGYPLALAVNLTFAWHQVLIIRHLPGVQRLEDWTVTGTVLVFGGGVLILLARAAWVALHSPNRQYVFQARFLILALLLALPMSFFEMILRSLHIPWLMARTSNLTFMFWVVPAAALIAYSMLRYQAFTYRGIALNGLVIFFTSAFFTQIYAAFAAPRGLDGVQFVMLFGAVLLITLFWFVDSPLRRSFRRLFVRHEYDYEITDAFSHTIAGVSTLDECAEAAALALCRDLDLAWVAIWVRARAHIIYLAKADATGVELLRRNDHEPDALLPARPVCAQPLDTGLQEMGMIWVGERMTAELFDSRDCHLLELLAQALARSLANFQQIDILAEFPAQILRAVEAERQRIGQDLHDGVLQFIGAVPLEMDRAALLSRTEPARSLAILERNAARAEAISAEMRAIVYDLSPPFLTRGSLLSQAKQYVSQGCTTHNLGLLWQAEEEGWAQLSSAQAIQVYRIFQQAVANVWAHAQATKLWVTFLQEKDVLLMTIMDNGRGFSEEQIASEKHLGLITMRQRARAISGELEIISEPGRGTLVRLKLPRSGGIDLHDGA